MKVAYLINLYPRISHTFIRREIAGIELAGLEVDRISVRTADERLVDEQDRAEGGRTRVLLGRGVLGLLPSVLATSLVRPVRTLRALRTTISMGRSSPLGVLRHLAYLAEACLLLRWTTRAGVEHVHAHFAINPVDVALLCRKLGGPPFSFTAHGMSDLGPTALATLPIKIQQASFVVAVCEDGRRQLLEQAPPGHEGKIHVIRCGVDESYLTPGPQGVPSAPRLVCVARLSQEKGIPVLLRAARLLMKEGLDLEISVIGDGPERSALEALSRDLDLGPRVRFLGWNTGAQVRARILHSRALVLSSLAEGLPVVIMEALALRRPVISTAVGGIPELVQPGVCGWLVPPGSEAALAEAMREALTLPPSELDAMGRRGAERVAAAHDASIESRALAQLFQGGKIFRVST